MSGKNFGNESMATNTIRRARRGSSEHTADLLSWANPQGPTKPEKPENGTQLWLEREKIRANFENPREYFDPAELKGLAQSMRVHGILKPLTVRYAPSDELAAIGKPYELIDGERRWRAAEMAGLEQLPVMVRDAENKFEQLVMSLVANVQTANLSPYEEAKALGRIQQTLGLKAAGLVEMIGKGAEDSLSKGEGKGKGWVENRLYAFHAPAELKAALQERPQALSSVVVVARRIKDPSLVRRCAQRIRNGATLREIQELVDVLAPQQKKQAAAGKPAQPVEPTQGTGIKAGGGTTFTPAPESDADEIFPVSQSRNNTEVTPEDAGGRVEAPQVLEASEVELRPEMAAMASELRAAAAHDKYLQSRGQGGVVLNLPEPTEAALSMVRELCDVIEGRWLSGATDDELRPLWAQVAAAATARA